jgi:septum formation protein
VISFARPLGLGSTSPRRKELLEKVGIPILLVPVDVDEERRANEPADAYLERIVASKLASAASQSQARGAGALLVADTIVLLDGTILGKPAGLEDARSMLTRLSGRTHEVHTRFALGRAEDSAGAPAHAETVASRVTLRRLSADEIARYVATGEGKDKAGSYAIQGIGSFAVQRIEGSYANVVGLPVCEVVVALQTLGLLGDFP